MGAVVSKAVNGIGAGLASVFVSPIKTIFGTSCEGVCSGTWDVICFIENFCISSLVKLLMVLGLCYIMLLFIYLLFKVGIIQCIGRSLCKMTWAACKTYWRALEYIFCFLWYKLKNTKRMYHGRRRFLHTEGYCSSVENCGNSGVPRGRSVRERRKDRMKRSLHRSQHRSKVKNRSRSGHHRMRWKMSEVSVQLKDCSRPHNSRRLQRNEAAIVRLQRRR